MTDDELAQMKQRVDVMFEMNYSAAALNYVLSDMVTLLLARLALTGTDPRKEASDFMRATRISVTGRRELHAPSQYQSAELVDQALASLEASVHRHLEALGHPPPDGKSDDETD